MSLCDTGMVEQNCDPPGDEERIGGGGLIRLRARRAEDILWDRERHREDSRCVCLQSLGSGDIVTFSLTTCVCHALFMRSINEHIWHFLLLLAVLAK